MAGSLQSTLGPAPFLLNRPDAVFDRATAATMAAPATRYSQLSATHAPAAARPVLWESFQEASSASVSGWRPEGSLIPTGLLPAQEYGLPAQPAPAVASSGSRDRNPRVPRSYTRAPNQISPSTLRAPMLDSPTPSEPSEPTGRTTPPASHSPARASRPAHSGISQPPPGPSAPRAKPTSTTGNPAGANGALRTRGEFLPATK